MLVKKIGNAVSYTNIQQNKSQLNSASVASNKAARTPVLLNNVYYKDFNIAFGSKRDYEILLDDFLQRHTVLKEALEEEIKALAWRDNHIIQKVAERKKEIQAILDKYSPIAEERATLKTTLQDLNKQNTASTPEKADLGKKIQDLKQQLAAPTQRIVVLKDEIKALEQQRSAPTQKIKALEDEIATLEKEILE